MRLCDLRCTYVLPVSDADEEGNQKVEWHTDAPNADLHSKRIKCCPPAIETWELQRARAGCLGLANLWGWRGWGGVLWHRTYHRHRHASDGRFSPLGCQPRGIKGLAQLPPLAVLGTKGVFRRCA